MKNVAGWPRAAVESVIVCELGEAGIDIAPCKPGVEVFSHLGGTIGHLRLRRAWRYWVVAGLVPLAVAEPLYAHPVGREDVRVRGDCTCPPPFGQAYWVAPDGRRVLRADDWDEAKRFSQLAGTEMARIGEAITHCTHRADDPSLFPGATGHIDGYHIDTAAGLLLFADAIRAAGLAVPELPPEHARVKSYAEWEARRLAW